MAAGTVPPDSADPALARGERPLYTSAFGALCLSVLFAFTQNLMLQPVIPLLIVDLGGDAALVGVAFLAFTIPSVVLRPAIGGIVDRVGPNTVLSLAAVALSVTGPMYALPSLAALMVARVVHGLAWAGVNTGGTSMLVALAPSHRRGEASAMYELMPGIATLCAPPAALALYGAFGVIAPIAASALMGCGALLSTMALMVHRRSGNPRSSDGVRQLRSGPLLERSAVVPMFYQLLLNAVLPLFIVYPPLLALERGFLATELVTYYVVYGVTFMAARIVAGRLVDRLDRTAVLIAGAALASLALTMASLAQTPLVLAGAGALYAAANGATSPATTALVIDRAPVGRAGSAMALYTLGFQVGTGVGAALWGWIIDQRGFVLAFVLGAAVQIVLFMVSLGSRGRVGCGPRSRCMGPS